MSISSKLDILNPAQREAVCAPAGNLLVLAGAGSGKTRVLVHRIAWLVAEQGVSPLQILAVTFTNKAAAEMRSRLELLLGRRSHGMWVGTFHGLSHKLMRLHWAECGLQENFQVIDSDDQYQLIRRIFKEQNLNEDRWDPRQAQGFINRKKDEGLRAAQLSHPGDIYEETMAQIYRRYEEYCQQNVLVDFAELLLGSHELLSKNAELALHYQTRFKHSLVDEFQDTNTIQYQWLKQLTNSAESMTVVGDDDQSIYGWRGAKIENIHRFQKDYQNTSVVRLEQNYRSTSTILKAANALIMNNDGRMGKTLWTEGEAGEPINVYCAFSEEDEALYVVRQAKKWLEQGGVFSELAVLYRSNAQSRVLEEALVRAGIPYVIYGGLRFFERAEIKDALSYLRLMVNCHDNMAFERIVNVPPRGIGDKTFEKIKVLASQQELSLWDATLVALKDKMLTSRAAISLEAFMALIIRLREISEQGSLADSVEAAVQESGLIQYFRDQFNERALTRAENLEELINASSDFASDLTEEWAEALGPTTPLLAFLSHACLEAGDRRSGDEQSSVQLMTLHSAKGLEFPSVFICGLEEGLFPHHSAKDSLTALEEERRLCYVGITRAMKELHLCYAEKRRLFGREEMRRPSKFLEEVPAHLIKDVSSRVKTSRAYPYYDDWSTSTAAEIATKELQNGYYLGQRVVHAKFGEGTVLDFEGQGERARIHVHFDGAGSKWLVLELAKLESA